MWKGCAFGGIKGRSQLPDLVDDYMTGKLKVDECKSSNLVAPPISLTSTSVITHRKKLDELNDAFTAMHGGDCIR